MIFEYEECKVFQKESNAIESIAREPTDKEVNALLAFIKLKSVNTEDLIAYVRVIQPDAKLRIGPSMNVAIGGRLAPEGGKRIITLLDAILAAANEGDTPFHVHQDYEHLHPFMDGNGRSGRALWLWMMLKEKKHTYVKVFGFLRYWYYQSLSLYKASEYTDYMDNLKVIESNLLEKGKDDVAS